jgi:hypothetical protein
MENKNKIYHAVEKTPYRKDELKIFLAGTIDNGDSEDWQTKICRLIEECTTNSKPIAVYNPRRDDWPKDDQTKLIEEQIKWELEHFVILHRLLKRERLIYDYRNSLTKTK